jgi:isopenicillin-N epimerase
VTFLNHCSFGVCPRAVFERYQEWQLELERQSVLFLARRLEELLAEARGALGAYLGADPDEIVETIWSAVGPRTRVLYLSHHTSTTAMTLPVGELCRRAREAGIRTVIDGAHVPGQIPLDLRALDADYYSGNCHKWLCAPKGAGFLYVRRELQEDIHPLVISWGYEGDDPSFLSRHERQGTRDPSAYLTVPAAIEWQQEHDWDAVRDRCHELARRARNELGLEPLVPDSGDFFGQMVTLRLPAGAPDDLQERLYDEHFIEIPVFEHGDDRFIRASFQGYNDAADLAKLKVALGQLLP